MAENFRMNYIDWTALVLVVVGALNWGLIGVGYFVDEAANWNLVNIIFESIPELEAAIYILVGLASLWAIYLATRLPTARMATSRSKTEGGPTQ